MDQEIEILERSAQEAHEGATHEDAVAKSKYDTHGLELSYLAGSQYERARKLATDRKQFFDQSLASFDGDTPIAATALVALQNQGGTIRFLYISQPCAGIEVDFAGKKVQVLSPESPLGLEVIDSYLGDEVEVGQNSSQSYEIIDLI